MASVTLPSYTASVGFQCTDEVPAECGPDADPSSSADSSSNVAPDTSAVLDSATLVQLQVLWTQTVPEINAPGGAAIAESIRQSIVESAKRILAQATPDATGAPSG